jgi:quercetin dioxygenase-like cupin family protein
MKMRNFRIIQLISFCIGILFNLKAQTQMETNTIFPKGEKLTNGYFTGDAFLKVLLARDKNNDFVIGNVTFEPGARTNWHTHPKGQVLIVTSGEGFYQEKGKPAQIIKKGDVVNIPENTEHWHGASAKTGMIHIAITHFKEDVNVVWLQPVSEQEYEEVNKNSKP